MLIQNAIWCKLTKFVDVRSGFQQSLWRGEGSVCLVLCALCLLCPLNVTDIGSPVMLKTCRFVISLFLKNSIFFAKDKITFKRL